MNKEQILLTLNKYRVRQVNFALVDDFDKMSDNYFKKGQKFEKSLQEIEQGIKNMQKNFIELQKEASKIDSEYQKVRKSAMDLGVDVPKEVENDYKRVLASLKQDMKSFQKYNK